MDKNLLKNQDSKKESTSPKSEPTTSQRRPSSRARKCRNSACRARLPIVDTFCKRCSCCICHLYDQNKDPSLWLECMSDYSPAASCGLSCHIECAFQHRKVGVVDCGPLMQLDGSYSCASCGNISGILGCWMKQLTVAKEAQCIKSLCYRIFLTFRLFEGTTRFHALHEVVKAAKAKLETEVGPLDGLSANLEQGIVSRLPVAEEVQALCNAAIQKADEVSATLSSARLDADGKEGSTPTGCKFIFEEVSASSVVLVILESSIPSSSDVYEFKLWYSKDSETYAKDPVKVYPRSHKRIKISELEPGTKYLFKVVTCTKTVELGYSEGKCCTGSVEIPHNNSAAVTVPQNEGTSGAKEAESDFGKVLQLACVEKQGHLDNVSGPDASVLGQMVNPDTTKADVPSTSNGVNLVPDLNVCFVPTNDSSTEEERHVSAGGSDNQGQLGPNKEVAAVDFDSQAGSRKRPASIEAHKEGPFDLYDNFGYCVKTIRSLECKEHISEEFRLKMLTWFCLKATDEEQRVIYTFIRALGDDPEMLAGQLVDSFADIINNKRPRNDF